jgi:ribonuclease D
LANFVHVGDLPDGAFAGATIIAIDSETMGLRLGRDPLCVVQLSSGDGDAHVVQLDRSTYDAPNLKRLLTDPKVLKLFHFGRFDIAMFLLHLGVMTAPVYCTKIASKLARTYTDRHGLKDVTRELLAVELSKAQQSSDWGAATLAPNRWPTPPPTCCICMVCANGSTPCSSARAAWPWPKPPSISFPTAPPLTWPVGKTSTSSPIPEDSDATPTSAGGRSIARDLGRWRRRSRTRPAAAPGAAGGDHRDPDRAGRTGGLALAAVAARPPAEAKTQIRMIAPRFYGQSGDGRSFMITARSALRDDNDLMNVRFLDAPTLTLGFDEPQPRPGDGEVGDLSRRHDEAGSCPATSGSTTAAVIASLRSRRWSTPRPG